MEELNVSSTKCFWHLHNHSWTWISSNGHAMKGTDHNIIRKCSIVKSHWVFSGTEAPVNSDHRLAVTQLSLHLPTPQKPDSTVSSNFPMALLKLWNTHRLSKITYLTLVSSWMMWQSPGVVYIMLYHTPSLETISFRQWHKKPWLSEEAFDN